MPNSENFLNWGEELKILRDESKTQVGYKVSFTRYFYKPLQMRTLEEIMSDIRAIERETDGLLNEVVGEAK